MRRISRPSLIARSLLVVFSGLWLAARAGQVCAEEELRTWSDRSGKHKIEAKFKEVTDGKVTLVRKDGSEMEIALQKLSEEDRKYVAAREDEDNPFQAKSADARVRDSAASAKKPGARMRHRGGQTPSNENQPMRPDWSKAQSIGRLDTAEAWKIAIARPAGEQPQLQARSISTPGLADHEQRTATVISGSGGYALIGSVSNGRDPANPREEISETRVVLCDLKEGKVVAEGTIPGKYIPVAIDDAGKRALLREDIFGFDEKPLEIWNLSSSGAALALRWWPGVQGQNSGENKWGAFLGEDRLITLSDKGAMVVWNAETAQPIAYQQVEGECQPVFSADRRYLIYGGGRQIAVLDVNAVRIAAEMPVEMQLVWPQFCLSPDGSRLACRSGDSLTIWNFADGKREQQIPLAGINAGRELLWPHEKYLLLGNSSVFDIENQIVLWRYQGVRSAWNVGSLCLFSVDPFFTNPGALVLATVPPPIMSQVLDSAMQSPDFFVLGPGTAVKLNVDGVPHAEEREKVRLWLTEGLKANGFVVGTEGTIELVASVDAKPVEQTYRRIGIVPETSPRVQTYQLQAYTSRLAFLYQGKPAWQIQAGTVPHMVMAKRGQSIEEALHETEKPNYALFEHAMLPKKLMKPMPESALGTSKVTAAGVQ